jgi:hypothetical protein
MRDGASADLSGGLAWRRSLCEISARRLRWKAPQAFAVCDWEQFYGADCLDFSPTSQIFSDPSETPPAGAVLPLNCSGW